MKSLLHIVNKLQDVFAIVGEQQIIDLPQIVVVGSQSSGKSSVLESIVGKSFLPRGTGIVTRAPLVIQMIKYTPETKKSMLMSNNIENTKKTEWVEFLHKPNHYFFDFDTISNEIESRTNILAGNNKGITDKQIVLKVHTNRYDLTFVDLPGLTKVAVGDQPADIDEQIYQLITSYVKQPNSIILAVVTANTDPSTSESLQIAKKLDPDGLRTIAVVTKLDIIDAGTLQDAKDLLCGRKIPVKLLGIVGVVNRSQKEIVEKKSMEATLNSETEFLKTNYPDIYKKHGNKALVQMLQTVLIKHIKKVFPQLRVDLETMKSKFEKQIVPLYKPEDQKSFLTGFLKDISRSYEDTVNGNQKEIPIDEIVGGASIIRIFQQKYLKRINDIDTFSDLSDENIAVILLNTSGITQCTFVNEKALQNILRLQLKKLIEPSLDCLELVRIEMLTIFNSIDVKLLDTLKRYPKLNEAVRKAFENFLDENLIKIREFIESYIETYQDCINTANPDFILEIIKSDDTIQEEILKAINIKKHEDKHKPELVVNSSGMPLFPIPDRMSQIERLKMVRIQMFNQLLTGLNYEESPQELPEQIKLHKYLCQCYFEYIRKIVRDFVPKRISHKMINSFIKDLDKRLNEEIFQTCLREENIGEILSEHESIEKNRKDIEIKLGAIKSAIKTMVDIQYF